VLLDFRTAPRELEMAYKCATEDYETMAQRRYVSTLISSHTGGATRVEVLAVVPRFYFMCLRGGRHGLEETYDHVVKVDSVSPL
jgi:hypothetical protein